MGTERKIVMRMDMSWKEYVYDGEIVVDLNGGYMIPRVNEVIATIKANGFAIKMYNDSKTAIVVKADDFLEVEKLIDMPYSL